MLITNKRSIANYDDVRMAAIGVGGDDVYCVTCPPTDCAPDRRCKNPAQLLTSADWHAVTKKYRLGNAAIRQLKKFWALGEPEFVTDNARLQWAFSELEDLMVGKLKRRVQAKKGVRYLPFHDASHHNNSVNSHLIIGSTGAGKTRLAQEILLAENGDGECWAKDRPIVCFALHPDPSLELARKKYKKNWIDINYERLDGKLDLQIIPKGAIVLVDDCLELLSDWRSKLLYDLCTQIATTGRHHRDKKRGTELICITHHGGRKQLQTIRNAVRYLTMFPQGSRLQTEHILKSRLGYTKTQVKKLLQDANGSRYMTVDLHHPMKIITQHSVQLLE